MKFLLKMVLGKFREHPVLVGSEVFIEIGTGEDNFRERPVFVANQEFHESDTGKIS